MAVGASRGDAVRAPRPVWEVRNVMRRDLCSSGNLGLDHRLTRLAYHLIVHVNEIVRFLSLHILPISLNVGGPK